MKEENWEIGGSQVTFDGAILMAAEADCSVTHSGKQKSSATDECVRHWMRKETTDRGAGPAVARRAGVMLEARGLSLVI